MARSEKLERMSRKIGFYAFNRYARNHGLPIECTLAVIRNVF
jgi:hypothetical protein